MKVIITGGAGFIGSNAASRYLRNGDDVIVIDNLSRNGAEKNLEWLKNQGKLIFYQVDVRDKDQLQKIFQNHDDVDFILHLAAQVAVTTSIYDPRTDFDINAFGSFNVLESLRQCKIFAPVVFASTNKVYGAMEELRIVDEGNRYLYSDFKEGIAETRKLCFHSPYGCSKGAADQYFYDYHRIYGIRTIVFRMSCVYGYRQFGIEDQGWVAWFIIASLLGKPITIYGDGKQTRDILFIDDLLDAFDKVLSRADMATGNVYNIGGGPENAMSLLDLLSYLEKKMGRSIPYQFSEWRPGDQKVYITDISRAKKEINWYPKTRYKKGLDSLYAWVSSNKEMFS